MPRPFQKGHPKLGGRKPGTPNKTTVEHREFLDGILTSETYRASVQERLLKGAAPQLEKYAWELICGKPTDHIEHSGEVSLPTKVVHIHEQPRD